MKYLKGLVIDKEISSNPYFLKWRIDHNRAPKDTYVLSIPENGHDILEIHKASLLKAKYYKTHPLLVAGIARGYEEAVMLCARLVKETYDSQGNFDVKGYLKEEHG